MITTPLADYITKELPSDMQKTAQDFIGFCEKSDMTFYRDMSACWKDKVYFWIMYKNETVGFLAVNDPDEKENYWTVWSEDISEESLNYSEDEGIKQAAWRYADVCGNCGSCSGGKPKMIFGKKFRKICGCTFRVDNPTSDDLLFIKRIIDIKKSEILRNEENSFGKL